jgi:hypothetical protein
MRHVDQPTLDAIINGQLSPRELVRLKEHVRICPLCARRLEEYRDLFSEVESIIPTAERGVLDDEERRGWRRILLPRSFYELPHSDRLIWGVVAAAGVVTAIAAAVLLRSPTLPPPPVVTAPPATETPPAAVPTPTADAPSTSAPSTPLATPQRASSTPSAPVSARLVPPQRAAAPPATSGPGFHGVESAQAIRALGGTVRLIDGLIPDHFEMAVGTGVPGAVDSLPVVRVVYHAVGSPLLLDEQRRNGITPGDTLVGTAQAGVSVLQWNSTGFWLSLAGRISPDSLEQLARRIR